MGTKKKSEAAVEGEAEVIESLSLGTPDQRFLARVMRFLIGIQTAARATRARREGYTAREHGRGWELWRTASGQGRTVDQLFTEVQGGVAGPERQAILKELDQFENVWFPRTRAVIMRVVPRSSREAFYQGFFKDLSQQPLGPAVVGSVGTFLQRVDGLADSTQPAAKDVLATLRERGLTPAKVDSMRQLIARLEREDTFEGTVDPKALKQAQEAQLAALADLRDWFNDWSETLRTVFNTRDQVTLGLILLEREERVVELEDEAGPEASSHPPAPVAP
jgi:hypothetical protein